MLERRQNLGILTKTCLYRSGLESGSAENLRTNAFATKYLSCSVQRLMERGLGLKAEDVFYVEIDAFIAIRA